MLKEAMGGLFWVWTVCYAIGHYFDGYGFFVHYQVGIQGES